MSAKYLFDLTETLDKRYFSTVKKLNSLNIYLHAAFPSLYLRFLFTAKLTGRGNNTQSHIVHQHGYSINRVHQGCLQFLFWLKSHGIVTLACFHCILIRNLTNRKIGNCVSMGVFSQKNQRWPGSCIKSSVVWVSNRLMDQPYIYIQPWADS